MVHVADGHLAVDPRPNQSHIADVPVNQSDSLPNGAAALPTVSNPSVLTLADPCGSVYEPQEPLSGPYTSTPATSSIRVTNPNVVNYTVVDLNALYRLPQPLTDRGNTSTGKVMSSTLFYGQRCS